MAKEKNWLIRTSNFQILGPVSKEKILEFVEKGSLKAEDEVTSGNGYWFHVREKDLLEKYLFGNIPQTFNPITEAPNVLTANMSPEMTGTHNKIVNPPKVDSDIDLDLEASLPEEGDLEYPDMTLPEEGDLEYPDMGGPSGELNIEALNISPTTPAQKPVLAKESVDPLDEIEGVLPDDADLEYPDFGEFEEVTSPTNPRISEFDEETDPNLSPMPSSPPPLKAPGEALAVPSVQKVVKRPVTKKKVTKVRKTVKKKQRNDKLFLILTSVFFLAFLFVAIIFYYKKVINKPLPFIGKNFSSLIFSTAHAQTTSGESLVKKKVFLNLIA